MFLWQPIPATFYSPCVDGDYDMSVIAHEYGHLVSNRMVAGPNAEPRPATRPQAMGESWSDLRRPSSSTRRRSCRSRTRTRSPSARTPPATSVAGIRNYAMNASPLNYSDVGYDFACNQAGTCTQRTQVHADGEIWSATNYDIRQALINARTTRRSRPANIALQQVVRRGRDARHAVPGQPALGAARVRRVAADGDRRR